MSQKTMSEPSRMSVKKADDEAAVLSKIAEMPEPYRAIGGAPPRPHPPQRPCARTYLVVRHAGL